MADPEKIEKYEHLLNNVLRENLRIVLEERDKVYEDIAAHSQLKQMITCIIESPDQEGLRTKVDLGSNFYVQAHVPDTSRIYVNVGLGFFLELTLQEALGFIDKKLELLNVKLKNGLQWCPVVSPHLQGQNNLMSCDVEVLPEEEIVIKNDIQEGGLWKPQECQSRYRVAIIVPFRNRSRNLQQFLSYMHPFLTRQQLNYRIVVVEQTAAAAFNRAKLFNIGFVETLKLDHYDCFIFHDVDLLPLNDYNTYGCTHHPRHMYSALDTFRYNLPYRTLFGGAIAMQRVHFQKVNGFSNKFYGWGAEDDDMYERISNVGLVFVRFDPRISTYIMVSHQSSRLDS
ncbi:hypothetical protein O3P69_005234 [Scylla paramamosain]|uniref:Beta-1,4-N-acetylgalactosaminyltransferase n=1 Tax=Scylla paramamosain TaxID=85552 RepID=A0AAW0U9G2_SCYPA